MEMASQIVEVQPANGPPGLTATKIIQLGGIQAYTNFNVLVLTETHLSPTSSVRMLQNAFSNWHFRHVPCNCGPRGRGQNGVAILVHPTLGCGGPQNVHIGPLGQDDHRQIAATLTSGVHTCHLVGLHYRSGVHGPGSQAGANKVLQMNATVDHYAQFGPNNATTVWVAVGDTNISISDPMLGQMQRSFSNIGMRIESYLQLGTTNRNGNKTHPWTHLGPSGASNNMLDYAMVRSSPSLLSRVDLVNTPPISSDHPNYLVVTIGLAQDVTPKPHCSNWSVGKICCIHCGRGNDVTSHGPPCPCIDIPGLVDMATDRSRHVRPLPTPASQVRATQRKNAKVRKDAGLPPLKRGQNISRSQRKPDREKVSEVTKRRDAAKARIAAGQPPRKRGGQRKPDREKVSDDTKRRDAAIASKDAGLPPLKRGGQTKPDRSTLSTGAQLRDAAKARKDANLPPVKRGRPLGSIFK
ncbi:uncharacterized protein LOC110842667 isoform X2 [Folsomia candida]|uniref:uncharacterized protein LOC110842667 isoform X2 n=1 Tax=Folsomia candida TaxID=158441 RepID=UPI001604E86B|nr:uncharacterized protein LOC110842667 isoform X2 [Folsomia candida]